MQEELNPFERNKICELVLRPSDHMAIGIKQAFRNKLIEFDDININKARHITQGFNQ